MGRWRTSLNQAYTHPIANHSRVRFELLNLWFLVPCSRHRMLDIQGPPEASESVITPSPNEPFEAG